MFVRDEDAGQHFGRAVNSVEAIPYLASAQAGIDQEPRLARFKIRAIALRTAAQNGQMNRHALTLRRRPNIGNVFPG
jgi:hypothetical protein